MLQLKSYDSNTIGILINNILTLILLVTLTLSRSEGRGGGGGAKFSENYPEKIDVVGYYSLTLMLLWQSIFDR